MAFDPAFHRHHDMLILIWWSLPASLMRPMRVVVIDIFAQDRAQVTFPVEQQAIGALGSHRPDPALGEAVRPRCPRRHCSTVIPTAANTSSKAVVNLASRSRMKKRNDLARSPRSIRRLRACWAVRAPVG